MNTVYCLLCDRNEIDVHKLSSHIASDLGYAPYSCGECDFSSADKNDVVVHTFKEKHFTRQINAFSRPYVECLIDRIVNDCLLASSDGLQAVLTKNICISSNSCLSSDATPNRNCPNGDNASCVTRSSSASSYVPEVKTEPVDDDPPPKLSDQRFQQSRTAQSDERDIRSSISSAISVTPSDDGDTSREGENLSDEPSLRPKRRRTKPDLYSDSPSKLLHKKKKPSLGDHQTCRLCSRTFPTLTRRWMHAAVHLQQKLSCPYCDFRDVSVIRLLCHTKSVHAKRKFTLFQIVERDQLAQMADICFEKETGDQQQLQMQHQKIHSKIQKTNQKIKEKWKLVECKLCRYQMPSSHFHKRNHVRNVHATDAANCAEFFSSHRFHSLYSECFGSTDSKQFGYDRLGIKCGLCGELASNLSARQTHVLTQHLQRSLQCPYCTLFTATCSERFLDHVRGFHKEISSISNVMNLDCMNEMKQMVLHCFQVANDDEELSQNEINADELTSTATASCIVTPFSPPMSSSLFENMTKDEECKSVEIDQQYDGDELVVID